ncbi:MAG: DUF1501 domain-containing protein [Planctomycetaceae bacterium]
MDVQPTIHRCFAPAANALIRAGSRRWFLQSGLAGAAGLGLSNLAQRQSVGAQPGRPPAKKSVILFWLSGGPSHIDMWDPKPDAPQEIRGPFGTIPTAVPGVQFSEHLPLQASIMNRLTVLRGVDCKTSNHTPITMQAGNALARRTDDGRDGQGFPSMGSITARFRGPNDAGLPAFIALADSLKADVWGAGNLGAEFAPVQGSELAGRFNLPEGLQLDRLQNRHELQSRFDRLQRDLDLHQTMFRRDQFAQQALDFVVSGKAQQAFKLDEESPALRDRYGRDSLGEKALLARRLAESGATFTVVSGHWGYFDHHGDSVKWGGIEKGLKPILPRVDQVLHTLILDLEERGLLDSTLVLMLGEFGRAPVINKDAGRDHWLNCMSMVMAGGGLKHGQVIGSTDSRGYDIQSRPVRPADLAATIFKYFDIDLGTHWTDPQGRPIPIVTEGGQPIHELFA